MSPEPGQIHSCQIKDNFNYETMVAISKLLSEIIQS